MKLPKKPGRKKHITLGDVPGDVVKLWANPILTGTVGKYGDMVFVSKDGIYRNGEPLDPYEESFKACEEFLDGKKRS